MTLKILLTAGLILTATAPLALADQHTGSGEGWFAKVDTDGNGTISKSEFLAKHEEKFDKMDTNGDGEISKEEKMAGKRKMKAMKEKIRDTEHKTEEEY